MSRLFVVVGESLVGIDTVVGTRGRFMVASARRGTSCRRGMAGSLGDGVTLRHAEVLVSDRNDEGPGVDPGPVSPSTTADATAWPPYLARIWREPDRRRSGTANSWDSGDSMVTAALASDVGATACSR